MLRPLAQYSTSVRLGCVVSRGERSAGPPSVERNSIQPSHRPSAFGVAHAWATTKGRQSFGSARKIWSATRPQAPPQPIGLQEADRIANRITSAGATDGCYNSRHMRLKALHVLAIGLLTASASLSSQSQQTASLQVLLDKLTLRNIGPFRSAAWVTTVAVPDSPVHEHLYTIWVGQRSGGVWKTTNGGVTWDPVFDSAGVAPIGAVAIAPSDSNIVWVGTGDQANARSSYPGHGVFKSTDGGTTWQFMGLPDSHHIARIVIHPTNPDIVYVAAIGHLFSKNAERGVFRTIDGGTHLEERALRQRRRRRDRSRDQPQVAGRPLRRDVRQGAPALADHRERPRAAPSIKTIDGGDTWQKLGGGLPTGKIGRIGLDIYRKNPDDPLRALENQNPRVEPWPRRPGRARRADAARRAGAAAAGIIGNELYRTDDGGNDVAQGRARRQRRRRQGAVLVQPDSRRSAQRPDASSSTSDTMFISRGRRQDVGRRIWPTFFRGVFGDFRTMWWDPARPATASCSAATAASASRSTAAHTADFFPNIGVGEVYAVGVDMDDPYHVYAGLQDHDSWKGPSNGRLGLITLEDWVTVGPGDGMYNVVDPTDSRWVYNTRELNQMGRMDQQTGVRADIAPPQPAGQPRLRYNWIAPIALSPHDPQDVYAGAQVLFRSRDRGDTLGGDQPRPHDERLRRRSATRARPSARSRRSRNRRLEPASSGSAPTTARCS